MKKWVRAYLFGAKRDRNEKDKIGFDRLRVKKQRRVPSIASNFLCLDSNFP
ncbi:conserved hypothetical protein [Ricinus communis]|uniref:Uncharacterized protein n=1 Tax=Ricinus communis TaxID=3988 RepID=B9T313_RICCO|nr:conserved hypothetical protein [Ricinus communis]